MVDWSTPHNLLPKKGIQDLSSNPSPAVTEAVLWLVPPQKQNDKELSLNFVDIHTQTLWGSLSHGDTVFWEWRQGQAFWPSWTGEKSPFCAQDTYVFQNFSRISILPSLFLLRWIPVTRHYILSLAVPHWREVEEFLSAISPWSWWEKFFCELEQGMLLLIWYYFHLSWSDLRQNHWSSDLWLWRKPVQIRALPESLVHRLADLSKLALVQNWSS